MLDWQAACDPYVAHYHMNDNHGKLDKHLPLGEGIAPWKEILPKMKKDVSVLIEVDSLEKLQETCCLSGAGPKRNVQNHKENNQRRQRNFPHTDVFVTRHSFSVDMF